MPEKEAPNESFEPASSRTSVADSNPSESESITLSDYEFEISIANSISSSSHSDDIILEVDSIASGSARDPLDSAPVSPVLDFDKWKLPFEYNLRQLLVKVTGTEDLESVTSVRLRVIARDFSLQRLPFFLPRLRELNLDGSCLMTLRDLGCDMQNLTILHVARTGLKSLDGLLGLPALIEFYAASNSIKDLSPCSSLQNVEVLDLGKNAITDIQKAAFLTLCATLKNLTLAGNPCSEINDYRNVVKHLLPDLKFLDGHSLDDRNIEFEPKATTSVESSPAPAKLFCPLPPIKDRNSSAQKEHILTKAHNKRPNTTDGNPRKDKTKLLPIRPATARKYIENDFSCIIDGSQLKLTDTRNLIKTKQMPIRPMSGNVALALLEKKRMQIWDDFSK